MISKLKTIKRHLRNALAQGIHQLSGSYLMAKRERVVMIHCGRCGSTVLASMLEIHPNIYWANELLKDTNISKYLNRPKPFDYKAHIRKDERKTFKPWYGFEMKYMHMRDLGLSKSEFLQDLSELGFTRFITLTRHNALRKHVSSRLINIKGYDKLRVSRSPELKSVTIDTQRLIPFLDQYFSDAHEMQQLLGHSRCLHLTYEDDVEQNPVIGYTRICEFLDVPVLPVIPQFRRVNPFTLDQMITNFDEVANTLQATKYAWMLEMDKTKDFDE